MSDDTAQPPRDPLAEQRAARDAVLEAMKEWEGKSYSRGYTDGWEACNEHWRRMLAQATQQMEGSTSTVVSEPGPAGANERRSLAGQQKAADTVFEIIAENPGIRGIDIVEATSNKGPPIIERTVRTALYRMKRDGQVKNLGGRWFTADDAPEDVSTKNGGENDG